MKPPPYTFQLFLCYLSDRIHTRMTVRQCNQNFRVWQVLLRDFRKVLPVKTRFFAVSTCTLVTNQRCCLGHQFYTKVVKVKYLYCCFRPADSKMTLFVFSMKTQEKSQNELLIHTQTLFLRMNIFVNINRWTDTSRVPSDVGLQDTSHLLHHCRL